MARRPKITKVLRTNGLSPELSSAAPAPSVDPSVFAPLDTAWIDAAEDETPAAEIPPVVAEPADAAAVDPSPYTVRAITDEDLDCLWDWIRQDDDRGEAFLGFTPKTSRELQYYFATLAAKVGDGIASLYTICSGDLTAGIAILAPIDRPNRKIITRLYFAPFVRGLAQEIIPVLLDLVNQTHEGFGLVATTTDEARMRLYRAFGFNMTYLMMRPSQKELDDAIRG